MVALGFVAAVLLVAPVAGAADAADEQPPADRSGVTAGVAAGVAAAPPGPERAEAAAALRATQDLEAKLIQIGNELAGLERQRASWQDVRNRLDELSARVGEMSRQLEPAASEVERAEPSWRRRPDDGAGWGGAGMVLRSPDDFFTLRPGLRLQARYEGALVDRGPGQPTSTDASGFLLRHAELMLQGRVFHRRFEYRLQLDFAEPLVVKDAFVQWRFRSSVSVRMGQFKVPFGFQRYLRSTYYDFVDLSEAMAAFSLERDVGMMVVGRPLGEKVQYQIAVTNGAGQGQRNDNLDLAYAVRIVAAPLGPLPESEGDLVGQPRPLLSVGGAGTYNLVPTDLRARIDDPAANVDVDGNGRVDNVGVWQGGVELRAHFRGAALQAEYFHRLEHPGAGAADRNTNGEYVQASYFVIPHRLQLAARLERTDLPLYGVPLVVRQAAGKHVDAQTGAVSTYLHGHDLKVQVDYTHLRTAGVETSTGSFSPDKHRVRAQVQLMF
jgi:phosphate-selective porin OprO/OprP